MAKFTMRTKGQTRLSTGRLLRWGEGDVIEASPEDLAHLGKGDYVPEGEPLPVKTKQRAIPAPDERERSNVTDFGRA